MTAPTIPDMMDHIQSPVAAPPARPIRLSSQPPRTAPTIPMIIVTTIPPGLSPGITAFASAPAISPTMFVGSCRAHSIHRSAYPSTTTTCRDPPHTARRGSGAIFGASGDASMQKPASELSRIYLPRTPVNKGKKKGRSSYAPTLPG